MESAGVGYDHEKTSSFLCKRKRLYFCIKKKSYKWILYNKDQTKVLGTFRTKKDALHRERQIIYFKNKDQESFTIPI